MMMSEITTSPPYSIILVVAHRAAAVPRITELVSASSSCIAVGTLAEMDGETRIVLTDEPFEGDDLKECGSFGLDRIDGSVSVQTADGKELLQCQVSGESCSVRIYVNRLDEPDVIVLQVVPK
jgi:hypothetical protein